MKNGRKPWWRGIGLSLMLAFGLGNGVAHADEFLSPEQAFQLTAAVRDAGTVTLSWAIAPHYHLYRERLGFKADDPRAGLGQPVLPQGLRKFDATFGKQVETYQDKLLVQLPVTRGAAGRVFNLTVGYQGCADAGLCYAPVELVYRVDMDRAGVLTALADPLERRQTAAVAPPAAPVAAPDAKPADDDSSLARRTLQSGSLWRIGAAFLSFGLLLSFTPCVLPMVPILSSIIVGEGAVSRSRGLLLAAAYCAGMALVYTALGVGAGLAGEGLAGALQKPWVLLTFGALLLGLSLSMFDVYQLQMPSAIQSRLSQTGGGLRGGRFAGVFVMGALSALIVGPCVAGPLAGALLYISQTRDAWIGGWALFSMAAGMSVPLLLTGLSAGSLLPRAGAWMNGVKRVFGLLLIAVAIWMVTPVFPVTFMMAMWGAFAILCAAFLRPGEAVPAAAGLGRYAGKALGLILFALGLFELAGAASAGKDVLQPLSHLMAGAAPGGAPAASAGPRFTRIRNAGDLERILATAKTPVMLDFYADWCVACKEMERNTFSESAVGRALEPIHLLQVDVTANNDEDRALMKKFSLFGPPGIILFDAAGREIIDSRIIGYQPPQDFLATLRRAYGAGTAG